jgi:hypothetical protein
MNKNFITIENGRSILNLDTVTNITFLPTHNRIVYNFSNNIEINGKNGIQVIADYRYDDCTPTTYMDKYSELTTKLYELKFIEPIYKTYGHHWVNPKWITFINIDKKRNRLMFNLNNSVTKPVGTEIMLVNDFVYWTHDTEAELQASVDYVFNLLK